MLLLSDQSTHHQHEIEFGDWAQETVKQLKFQRWNRKPIEENIEGKIFDSIIAHKKIEGGRKKLIYVEMHPALHFVTNGNFQDYLHYRKNIPNRVVLFNTRKELVIKVESEGYLV